jgi:hypothetical protein
LRQPWRAYVVVLPGSNARQLPLSPAFGHGADWGPVPEKPSEQRPGSPLPLDPPWTPGGVDQQVRQELVAAEQQVCQGRTDDPGFGLGRCRPSSRQSRCTRLWFTVQPSLLSSR